MEIITDQPRELFLLGIVQGNPMFEQTVFDLLLKVDPAAKTVQFKFGFHGNQNRNISAFLNSALLQRTIGHFHYKKLLRDQSFLGIRGKFETQKIHSEIRNPCTFEIFCF